MVSLRGNHGRDGVSDHEHDHEHGRGRENGREHGREYDRDRVNVWLTHVNDHHDHGSVSLP